MSHTLDLQRRPIIREPEKTSKQDWEKCEIAVRECWVVLGGHRELPYRALKHEDEDSPAGRSKLCKQMATPCQRRE
jgi:hypothetical protein